MRMSSVQGKHLPLTFWWNAPYRCDNHYVIPAKTPQDGGKLVIEFEQERGFEHKMFKDEREPERDLALNQWEEFKRNTAK